jgi:hypothetical protein
VGEGGGHLPERRHARHVRERRLRFAQGFRGEHMLSEVAADHERGLHAPRLRPQRRAGHRHVAPAESIGEPPCEPDFFSLEAPVQTRLGRLLEDGPSGKVRNVHPHDPLDRHPPTPPVDRVDPLIPEVPSDDGHAIRCALEHLTGQIFRPLPLADVIVRLQHSNGVPLFVPLHRPPARHNDLRHVSLCVNEFPFPPASAEQLFGNLLKRFGEPRLQELVSDVADCLLTGPSVQFLGAAIPVGDYVVHVADEDRVMREVEQSSLLAQHAFRQLSLLDVGTRSVPFHDVSLRVAQRHSAQHEPAIFPVSPPQPCFLLERLSSRQGRAPLVDCAVFGMKCIHPAPAAAFLQRETGIVPETLIQKISRAVGEFAPDQRGDCVDDKSKLISERPDLLLRLEGRCRQPTRPPHEAGDYQRGD